MHKVPKKYRRWGDELGRKVRKVSQFHKAWASAGIEKLKKFSRLSRKEQEGMAQRWKTMDKCLKE